MNTFHYATAHGLQTTQLLDNCLNDIGAVTDNANVGFLYATDSLASDLQDLLLRLKTHAPKVSWVGCIGMGICTSGQEYYDEPALALMIGSFPEDSFRILTGLSSNELDDGLQSWWDAQLSCFALLHGDPRNSDIPDTLKGLTNKAYATFLNGGLSSSNDQRNYQIADRIISGELSGILFNEGVDVLTDHTQGCSPIGPLHTLSEVQRNIVVSLDDRPAVDVLKEEIGEIMSRDLRQSAGYIFAALPIPVLLVYAHQVAYQIVTCVRAGYG